MNAQLKSMAMAMAMADCTLFVDAWIIGGTSRLGAQYESSCLNRDFPHSLYLIPFVHQRQCIAAGRCSESAFVGGGIRSNNEFRFDATAR